MFDTDDTMSPDGTYSHKLWYGGTAVEDAVESLIMHSPLTGRFRPLEFDLNEFVHVLPRCRAIIV